MVQQLRYVQTYPFVQEALEANRLELHGRVYYLEQREMRYYEPGPDRFEFFEPSR